MHGAHPHKETLVLNNIQKWKWSHSSYGLFGFFLGYYLLEIAGCIQLFKQFRSLPERLLYLPLHQSPSLHIVCTKLVSPFEFPKGNSTYPHLHFRAKEMEAQWHTVTLRGNRNTLKRNSESHSAGTQVLLFLLLSCQAHSFVYGDLCSMKSPLYCWVVLLFSVESVLNPQDMLLTLLFWRLSWWEMFAPRQVVLP